MRKGGLQSFNRRFDRFGGLERIRAGRQFDRDDGGRFAVILRIGCIIFGAQADRCDIV